MAHRITIIAHENKKTGQWSLTYRDSAGNNAERLRIRKNANNPESKKVSWRARVARSGHDPNSVWRPMCAEFEPGDSPFVSGVEVIQSAGGPGHTPAERVRDVAGTYKYTARVRVSADNEPEQWVEEDPDIQVQDDLRTAAAVLFVTAGAIVGGAAGYLLFRKVEGPRHKQLEPPAGE